MLCWCTEGADVPSLEVFEPGLVRPAPPLHVSTNEVSLLGSMYVGRYIHACNALSFLLGEKYTILTHYTVLLREVHAYLYPSPK